jgi:ankyrin repeat protein
MTLAPTSWLSALGANRVVAVAAVLVLAGDGVAAAEPLVVAARRGDMATVRALVARHADVNAPDVDGSSALHWAVHHDDVGVVKLLLLSGARVDAANRYGVRPLSIACLNGSAGSVAALLDAGADPNTSQPEGETALMTAARAGSVEVVRMLIARGADVDAKEHWRGQTALMWAAAEGHVDVVRLLIEHGADIHARSTFPAAAHVLNPGGQFLRDRQTGAAPPLGLTPILFAVRGGHQGVVLALLDTGASVNTAAPSGYSLLHLAIENAHFELAAALLERGADPNSVGPLPEGLTPLHHVVQVRRPMPFQRLDPPVPTGSLTSLDLMRALIARGADVDADLATPLKKRLSAMPPAVRALWKVDEDMDVVQTPLWLAANNPGGPDPEAMELLVAAGAKRRAVR